MSFLDELMDQKKAPLDYTPGTGLSIVTKKGKAKVKTAATMAKKVKDGKHYERCHKSHKPVHLSAGVFTGGSCSDPVEGADVYVNLDRNAPFRARTLPWTPGIEFNYPIPDMSIPNNPENFKAMIDYLAARLTEGKHVHVGCIGGHGRTGMVLAALVKKINGTDDAITWARENYCKKIVETPEQIKFLTDHFGITAVKPSKSWSGISANGKGYEAGGKHYYPMRGSASNIWDLPKQRDLQ